MSYGKDISGIRYGKLVAIKPTGETKMVEKFGYANVIVEIQKLQL